ncbi:WD repeat-containing protein 61 [Marasmius fiardii PR-910]|nr:WD repeat-containing protein 61 [Marasmius fiardii PR-910]
MSLAFLHAHDSSEPHSDAVWDLSWTINDTVVSISADGGIKQWASSSGQPQTPNSSFPPRHTLGLVSLSISPDGRYALYNSIEGLTCLWDLSSGESVGRFESYARAGQSDEVEPAWSVSLNPKGETYASSGGSGKVTIHSAQPSGNFGERLTSITSGRTKFGMYCIHSPDGKRLALSSESGQIFIFDLESNSLVNTFTSHAMTVRSLSWSPDSSLLLSASEDKRLVLHDVRLSSSGNISAGGAVATFSGHSSWVLSTDISPDGRLGLSGSADKTIKVWDIAARACVSTIPDTGGGEVWAVSWRPKPPAHGAGAGAFVSGSEDGIVRWWRGAGAN